MTVKSNANWENLKIKNQKNCNYKGEDMKVKEIWKDVPGYEGYYQASNLGRVKGVERTIVDSCGIKKVRKERILQPIVTRDGYLSTKLSKDGKSIRFFVQRIIAMTFLGCKDYNDNWEVNHKDMNRENNMIDNLEWVTHQDNVKYSAEKGKYKHYGKDNPNYGSTTLKEFFEKHPEEKQRQARPGENNGRAVPIIMYNDDGFYKEFTYIRECAKYLIDNNISSSQINPIAVTISKRLKENSDKPYKGYKFKKLEK